jgi:hypothetical protein
MLVSEKDLFGLREVHCVQNANQHIFEIGSDENIGSRLQVFTGYRVTG